MHKTSVSFEKKFLLKKNFIMDKLKKYNVVPSNSDVFAISLVDEPAVDSNFIALSKQKPMEFKIQNEERRMLYGVALRADYPIYRRYGDEEFYLTFGKDAIRRLMTKFMKNFGQRSWTKDHMDFAEGITVVESWIVEDVENDKANALGIENFSEGSWCIGAKVDDDEIWQSIKEGRWKGFSVEAWVDMEEIEKEIKNNKENKNIDMAVKKSKFEEMIDKIKSIISDAVTEADGEDTEVQEEVIDKAADAVEEVVNKDETGTTDEVVEAAEDKTPTEEIVNDVVDTVQEETQTTEEAADNLQEVVDQLQAEVDSLKAENEELKKKNQKMSKQPSTKVVTNKTENNVGGIKGAFAALKAQGFIS